MPDTFSFLECSNSLARARSFLDKSHSEFFKKEALTARRSCVSTCPTRGLGVSQRSGHCGSRCGCIGLCVDKGVSGCPKTPMSTKVMRHTDVTFRWLQGVAWKRQARRCVGRALDTCLGQTQVNTLPCSQYRPTDLVSYVRDFFDVEERE